MSKKKQSSTSNSTQNTVSNSTATTHTDVPDWIKNPTMQVAGNIQGLLNAGPDAYAPQTSALQKQAFDSAATLGQGGPDYYGQARDVLGGIGDVSAERINAAGVLDNGLDQYYNPFKDQVLNPVLNDYDYQSGQTRAAQAAAAARNKAFGGSRYGIQEAQTEDALARGRASAEGTLLNQMYGQATGLAESDAARRQAAAVANAANALQAAGMNQSTALAKASQLAQLGTSSGAEARANLGVQAGLGGILTDQENAARQYPITFAGQQEGLLAGLNPELYSDRTVNQSGTSNTTGTSNSTQTQSGGLLESLGQAAQIAALFAPSDRRLKVAVRTLFRDWKGRRWVEFAYRWAPSIRRVGVIAQELLRTDPEAVKRMPGGWLAVDYGRL